MARISTLPPAGELTGDETVPLVQDGETRRADLGPLIDSLATPYVEAARAYAAVLTDSALGYVYASAAEGLADADVEDGSHFDVIAGGRHYRYLKSGGVATLVAEYLTAGLGDAVRDHYVLASMFPSLQAAIDAVSAAGGGTVALTTGTTTVVNSGVNVGISMKSNVTLEGAGYGSVLKLAAAADAHVFNIASGVSNVAIRNLRIDGTRASQSLNVHGIRAAGVDGLTIENVWLHDIAYYGIGVQDGTNKNVVMHNVRIWNTGADGIDLKNKNDDNEPFVLDAIFVKNWGLSGVTDDQTAIDLRGPNHVSNVWASSPGSADAVGIRFRQGEPLDVNGVGAHRSTLTGFYVDLGTATAGIGVNVVARDVTISNGSIKGGYRGVLVQDSGCKLSGIIVEGAADIGFFLDAFGSGLDADSVILSACEARGCGSDGLRIEGDNCEVYGFKGTGNTAWGLRIIAGAENTKVFGGTYSGNTAGQVTDGGTGSTFINVNGYVTEAYVVSASLALDSTGTRTATINHGLSKTPDLNKCIVSMVRETAVTDCVIGFIWVEAVSSSTITVRARVTTASATAGATFKLAVAVRA